MVYHGSALTARARARKQQLPRKKKVIKLTAEARKQLTAEQRFKRQAFDADVARIWQRCRKECEELGIKHHKPLRKCLDAVYLGAKISRQTQKTSPWRAYVSAIVKQTNDGSKSLTRFALKLLLINLCSSSARRIKSKRPHHIKNPRREVSKHSCRDHPAVRQRP